MKSGILLLNKNDNITSNSIINQTKWRMRDNGFEVVKIGHAGTLDPNATGLLIVLINGGTKISDFLLLNDKEYIATVLIGSNYDTQDIWGKLEEKIELTEEDYKYIKTNIDIVLKNMIGINKQIPPMYSSIKIHGQKLYELARRGKTIDLSEKEREIEILELERISDIYYKDNSVSFKIRCKVSKGTYIRTLSKKIGEALGYPSCMASLVRTKSGKFNLENAYTLDDIKLGNYQLINLLDAISGIKKIEADDKLKDDCINGRNIILDCNDEMLCISYENELIAIYEKKENNIYKAKRVWN